MNSIRKSRTSFVRYLPTDEKLYFNDADGVGGFTTSEKCNWGIDRFYLAENFKLDDVNIAFISESLARVSKKLATINPSDRSVVINTNADETSDFAYCGVHLFNVSFENNQYDFDTFLIEISLQEEEAKLLIDAINSENWKNLQLTVFFDELTLIKSLEESKEFNFKNFSFEAVDFSLTYNSN